MLLSPATLNTFATHPRHISHIILVVTFYDTLPYIIPAYQVISFLHTTLIYCISALQGAVHCLSEDQTPSLVLKFGTCKKVCPLQTFTTHILLSIQELHNWYNVCVRLRLHKTYYMTCVVTVSQFCLTLTYYLYMIN